MQESRESLKALLLPPLAYRRIIFLGVVIVEGGELGLERARISIEQQRKLNQCFLSAVLSFGIALRRRRRLVAINLVLRTLRVSLSVLYKRGGAAVDWLVEQNKRTRQTERENGDRWM